MKKTTLINFGRFCCITLLFAIIVLWSFHTRSTAQTQVGSVTIQVNVGEGVAEDGGGGGGPKQFTPPADAPGEDDGAERDAEQDQEIDKEPAICGNGAVEDPEQCDDGNLIDGDGCSSICLFEALNSNVVQPDPDVINQDTIDLDVQVFDPARNFQHVLIFFSHNNGPFQQLPGVFAAFPVPMNNLVDGTYDVYSVAIDTLGGREAPPPAADATFTVDLVPTVDLLAYPEKRIPNEGNWSTEGRLRFYKKGDQLHTVEYDVPTNDQGYSVVDYSAPDGLYDIAFKGRSHLSKFIRDVSIQNNADISLDYTFDNTFDLIAGDVQYEKDDFVNSLDVSATVLVLYQSDGDADLNKDGIVNSLDLSIEAINLHKRGEAP